MFYHPHLLAGNLSEVRGIRITLEVCTQAVLALHHSNRKNNQAEGLNYDLALFPPAFRCQLFLNVLSKTWHHDRM